jgi:hypothetical protein
MLDITPDLAAQEISASTRRDRRIKRWKCLRGFADRPGSVTLRIRPAASQARRLGYRHVGLSLQRMASSGSCVAKLRRRKLPFKVFAATATCPSI